MKKILGFSAFVLTALIMAAPVYADTLTRQLDQGMSGSDVGSLQSFLAKDNSLYPQGLITNFFGPLTFSAVSNFQARNGIATVGRVGPITLAALNAQMNGQTADNAVPVLSGVTLNVGRNTATISVSSNENTRATVHYQTTYPTMIENSAAFIGGISGTAVTDNALSTVHSITLTGLQPGTTYYYVVDTFDSVGHETMVWPTTFQTQQ